MQHEAYCTLIVHYCSDSGTSEVAGVNCRNMQQYVHTCNRWCTAMQAQCRHADIAKLGNMAQPPLLADTHKDPTELPDHSMPGQPDRPCS